MLISSRGKRELSQPTKLCTLPAATCCSPIRLGEASHSTYVVNCCEYFFDQVFQSVDRHFTYRSVATDKLSFTIFNFFAPSKKKAQLETYQTDNIDFVGLCTLYRERERCWMSSKVAANTAESTHFHWCCVGLAFAGWELRWPRNRGGEWVREFQRRQRKSWVR
jgi:hypothetical protein